MQMNRRDMLRRTGASGAALAAPTLLAACGEPGTPFGGAAARGCCVLGDLRIDQQNAEILNFGCMAPSLLNAQPWVVRMLSDRRWELSSNPRRWLPAHDPDNEQLLVTLGGLVENVIRAGHDCGRDIGFEATATSPTDRVAGVFHLANMRRVPTDTAVIAARRTTIAGHRTQPLSAADAANMLAGDATVHYLPRDSAMARWVADATVAAAAQQITRTDAQQEMVHWTRLDADDAQFDGSGLTPSALGMSGLAAAFVRHFYSEAVLTTAAYRQRQLETTRRLVAAGAGFMVVTARTRGAGVDDGRRRAAAFIDAGRRMEALLLRLQAAGIAAQPMSQLLEEAPWRHEAQTALGLDGQPAAIIRIGYVDRVPPPVSPRMPLGAWVLAA